MVAPLQSTVNRDIVKMSSDTLQSVGLHILISRPLQKGLQGPRVHGESTANVLIAYTGPIASSQRGVGIAGILSQVGISKLEP